MAAEPIIEVSPSRWGGEPTINDFPTQLIADMYLSGTDVEATNKLSRHELIVALWFEARHGDQRFHRWSVWARYVEAELRSAQGLPVDQLPLPTTDPA